jgi:hypothetical protein
VAVSDFSGCEASGWPVGGHAVLEVFVQYRLFKRHAEPWDLSIESHWNEASGSSIKLQSNLPIMGKRHVMSVLHDLPCRKQVWEPGNKTAHDCPLWEGKEDSQGIQHGNTPNTD